MLLLIANTLNIAADVAAMGEVAVSYADQAERDHAALKAAVSAGGIKVHIEDS